MSDNQDLKSKILSMRQKNFGKVIEKSCEKNDKSLEPQASEAGMYLAKILSLCIISLVFINLFPINLSKHFYCFIIRNSLSVLI